jgi:release factor glutamine methyltransferase
LSSEQGSKTYLPSDDTALLIEVLSEYRGERCLEIGFGSGAVIASLSGRFSMVVGTDLMSLDQAKATNRGETAGVVLADRACCFRAGAFDLVAFNPPYLPSEGFEDRAVDGGEGGVEVPITFLVDALRVLRSDGKIVLLLSDHGDLQRFLASSRKLGLSVVEKRRKRLFYETLVVYEISKERWGVLSTSKTIGTG